MSELEGKGATPHFGHPFLQPSAKHGGAFWNPLTPCAMLTSQRMTVGRSLLWGSQSWRLTKRQVQRLFSLHKEMLRRMLGLKRNAVQETFLDFYRKGMRKAAGILRDSSAGSWVQQWRIGLHRWAGHLARLPQGSLPKAVLEYRDIIWWRVNQIEVHPLRHAGRFKAWRWEDTLEKFHTAAWAAFAQRRESWKLTERQFAASS